MPRLHQLPNLKPRLAFDALLAAVVIVGGIGLWGLSVAPPNCDVSMCRSHSAAVRAVTGAF